MYPGTIINDWNDQSMISSETATTDSLYHPLILVVSSFDRGTEKLSRYVGDEFFNMFGSKMSFAKHGQAAIQAARVVAAGGELLVKRIVADDATLANIVFIAKITTETTQKTDENGNLLYYGEDGEETTTVTDNIVIDKTVNSVKWEAVTIEGCKTFEEVKKEALKLYKEEEKTFPLMIIGDNGRGVSTKAIRITPDYTTSKGRNVIFYNFKVYEGKTVLEKGTMTLDPDVVLSNVAYGLSDERFSQVNTYCDSSVYAAYKAAMAEALAVSEDELGSIDLINMRNERGVALENTVVADESVDVDADFGVSLQSGTNGVFGVAPVNSEPWTKALVDFFRGLTNEDEIYDVDTHKICAIYDANYPVEVKKAISAFVNFRKDMFFFRDLGLGITSYGELLLALEKVHAPDPAHADEEYENMETKFIGDYMTSYKIVDPTTAKRINVTMMYDFAYCMTRLFATSPHVPCAGYINGMELSSAIPGTINFTPRHTPKANQLDLIEDLRVNYAIFESSGNCIVQTLYNCHDLNSQLKYINNVLAIEEVLRAIRTACPRNRYSFQTGNDFSDFATAVSNVIRPYTPNFSVLRFSYTQDNLRATEKIFYGSLTFAFNNWEQTEIFDVNVINTEDSIVTY